MTIEQTGFLDTEVNTSGSDLGEQSAFLTQKDIDPSYEVTTVQDTVPDAPPIAVGGGTDVFAGQDLSAIISPFQDPSQIEERRKREKKIRDTIAREGGAGELFVSEPDIRLKDFTAMNFNIDTDKIASPSIVSSGKTDVATFKKNKLNERMAEWGERNNKDPFKYTDEDYREFAEEIAYKVATDDQMFPYADRLGKKVGSYLGDKLFSSSFDKMAYIRNPQSYYQTMTVGGTGIPDASGIVATDAVTGATIHAPSTAVAQGQVAAGQGFIDASKAASATAKETFGKVVQGVGTAVAAINAFEAFKEEDYIQAGLNAGVAYATMTGQPGLALALTAASVAQSFFRFGRGKPKPGMGGSEIKYDQETGQLAHSMTWQYNGFNPSQAKQHTDSAVKFINNYMKEFGVSLDPKKFPQGQSNWQYLSRIDVSPYKNGSQSGAEMIERWLSSGAFVGNPSVYDPNSGERKYFTSQEEYEIAMQRFANKQFS
jgi:hypothetical protein